MRRKIHAREEAGSEALSEIWAVPALLWFVLFIGILTMMAAQSTPNISADLAAENASIIEALGAASSQAAQAERELKNARAAFETELAKSRQRHQDTVDQLDKQTQRAESAERAVTRAQQQAQAAMDAANAAEERADRAENQLATRALETVFVVDESGSMRDENVRLEDDQNILFEALAPIAPLSVGLINYLQDRRTLPLQPVRSRSDDGGASLARLARHIDGFRGGGQVDLIGASREAMRMLNASSNPSAKRTIVIVSDVSVYETQNEAAATAFIGELAGWVNANERNAVLAIYTGDNARDRGFFKRLSDAGGSRITVTENISDMLPELLRAMTTR